MGVVEEIRNISGPDVELSEAVKQIESIPRPGSSSDRYCSSLSRRKRGDYGDPSSTVTRTGWKIGRGNVRRHLSFPDSRRDQEKYETREESPQEGPR